MEKGWIDQYREKLNLTHASFQRIEHDQAMVAVVYKIVAPRQEPLILKICARKNDYFREIYFLEKLAGTVPVPKIFHKVAPQENLPGAILMKCLKGDLIHEMTETLADEVGRCLARIHSHQLSGYGDPVHNSLSDDPIPYFSMKFKEGIDECKGHLPDDLIDRCERYFEAHAFLLREGDGPCVVHRDYRPGNLISYQNHLQGVIDWAGARASFAEEDLCSIDHSGWSQYAPFKGALLKGYQTIRKVPPYEKFTSLMRLNKAIATVGFTVKIGTWNSTHQKLYQYNREFLTQLLG